MVNCGAGEEYLVELGCGLGLLEQVDLDRWIGAPSRWGHNVVGRTVAWR